jgi:hypothetical protein
MAPPLGPQGWVWRGLETQEGAEATSEHTSVQSSNHRQVSSVDSRQGQPRQHSTLDRTRAGDTDRTEPSVVNFAFSVRCVRCVQQYGSTGPPFSCELRAVAKRPHHRFALDALNTTDVRGTPTYVRY